MVVIEDDPLLNDLLKLAIQARFHPRELHVFSSGVQGLEHCLAACPDLLIVDLRLPDIDGRTIIQRLRARWPELRVIVLTGESSRTLPSELLALGASGFVDKGSGFDEVENAVRRILANGMYFSAGLKPAAPAEPSMVAPRVDVLTGREQEIVRAVVRGLVSKEIAAELNLSPRTIEKSRSQIMAKLGLRDLPALVRWSVQHGLV